MQHGTGKYVLGTVTYEGQWVETLKHGQGTEVDSASGVTYTGAFADGVRHGTGKETDKAGKTTSVKYNQGAKA